MKSMVIKNQTLYRAVLFVIFAVYCLALVYILFCRSIRFHVSYINYLKTSYNLIPFKSITEYFSRFANHNITFTTFIANMLGNLLLFFPMGVLLPCFLPKVRGGRFIALGVGMIVSAELIQYFSTLGALDIDDVILNSVGLVLGYFTFILLSKLFKQKDNSADSGTC